MVPCKNPGVASIVEHSLEIARPAEDVFTYIDDFSTTKDWMYGLHKIEAVTDQIHGVGAEYDGVMKLGVSLTSRIKCTAWEPSQLIELTSIKGIRNTQRWSFTEISDARTRVDVWISYTLPGGPAGAAMGAAMKPFVGIAIKQTSENLARILEA